MLLNFSRNIFWENVKSHRNLGNQKSTVSFSMRNAKRPVSWNKMFARQNFLPTCTCTLCRILVTFFFLNLENKNSRLIKAWKLHHYIHTSKSYSRVTNITLFQIKSSISHIFISFTTASAASSPTLTEPALASATRRKRPTVSPRLQQIWWEVTRLWVVLRFYFHNRSQLTDCRRSCDC